MHICGTFFTSHNPSLRRRSNAYENYMQHSHFLAYSQNIALLLYKFICFHIFIINLNKIYHSLRWAVLYITYIGWIISVIK